MKILKTITIGLLLTLTSCKKDDFTFNVKHCHNDNKTNTTTEIDDPSIYKEGDKLICYFVDINEREFRPSINTFNTERTHTILNIDSINYTGKIAYTFLLRKDSTLYIQTITNENAAFVGTDVSDFLVISRKEYKSNTSITNVVKCKYIDSSYDETSNEYEYTNNEDFTPLKGYSQIKVWDSQQQAIKYHTYTPSNISYVESGK